MRARSTRGEETRRRIMSAACELFHKQGIVATSPDEIIEASRTGKGQFYHYFKSKEGLIHEVLQDRLEAIKSGSRSFNREISSWPELEEWFFAYIELQKSFSMTRGCPFGTIGNELTEADELIRQDINLIFEVIKKNIAVFFIKEKATGRLAGEASEDRLADFCIATIQGALLMGKIKRDCQPAEAAVREALAHLKRYAIMPERSTRRGGVGLRKASDSGQ
jgi:TetR/AcrR family transcriptional regulator, transcriptional repressor for nem operon